MAKCVRCGSKGLGVHVNGRGLCFNCLEREMRKKQEETERKLDDEKRRNQKLSEDNDRLKSAMEEMIAAIHQQVKAAEEQPIIEAYCDECFTSVPREHAEARKPCPKCGNTFYAVLNRERPMPNGNFAYFMQRQENMTANSDAHIEMQSIRKKTMTREDYQAFIEAGERSIATLEKALEEELEMLRRAHCSHVELPPYIPAPYELPDMYMRYGHWDDAQRIYDFCSKMEVLKQSSFDFPRLKAECEENRLCAARLTEIVSSGIHSQRQIKKMVKNKFSPRVINFILGKYAGLTREKSGSDFIVTISPKEEMF
jgi:hypothetical protein